MHGRGILNSSASMPMNVPPRHLMTCSGKRQSNRDCRFYLSSSHLLSAHQSSESILLYSDYLLKSGVRLKGCVSHALAKSSMVSRLGKRPADWLRLGDLSSSSALVLRDVDYAVPSSSFSDPLVRAPEEIVQWRKSIPHCNPLDSCLPVFCAMPWLC